MSARERRRKRRRLAAGAGLGIGVALGTGASAQAADFTVTNLNDSGAGSLRQAVLDANAAPGADRILFQSGLSGTITLTSAQLSVTGPTEFVGPGADKLAITETVAAQGIFYLAPTPVGGAITISGLKLSGASKNFGAVILSNKTDLTLRNAIVTGNTVTGQGNIYTYGVGASRLTVDSSVIDGNTGTAILADSTQVSIIRSTVSGNGINAGGNGGGIYSSDGSLLLDTVTMSGNNGGNFGGAISISDNPTTITRSTLSGNQATLAGGAIYANGPSAPLTIDSSTISGNGNPNFGGGVSIKDNPTAISSSTIAGNSATLAGGGIYSANTSPTLSSALIGDNTAATGPDLYDGFGQSFTAAFSLIESTADATINSTGPNVTGQDPKLGPLADNGGPTLTQALLAGSPALDKGNARGTDQRGAPRPFDLRGVGPAAGGNSADIGAYEQVLCAGLLVNRVGTDAADTLNGTPGADGFLALGGNDTATGLAGKDSLCGGPGNDKLNGGNGKDKVLGETGKDKLKGGPGKDKQKQ